MSLLLPDLFLFVEVGVHVLDSRDVRLSLLLYEVIVCVAVELAPEIRLGILDWNLVCRVIT